MKYQLYYDGQPVTLLTPWHEIAQRLDEIEAEATARLHAGEREWYHFPLNVRVIAAGLEGTARLWAEANNLPIAADAISLKLTDGIMDMDYRGSEFPLECKYNSAWAGYHGLKDTAPSRPAARFDMLMARWRLIAEIEMQNERVEVSLE